MKLPIRLSIVTILLSVSLNAQSIISVIPQPAKIEAASGYFKINSETKVWISPGKEMQTLGNLLTDIINRETGFKLIATWKMTKEIPRSLIELEYKKDYTPVEGYTLQIKPNIIKITAADGRGLFYGLQTLFQLIPSGQNSKSYSIPSMVITDFPRFKWRGMHLDICRHFFPVEFVKKYIDVLAMYKMNSFHWHLTDDQGWRIEIKKYPKLTEVGSWRKEEDGKTYGGFYTQDQIREVVEYAKSKYITVVPEIEMPGHALAALASYPEYSCTGGPFEVGTLWGVIEDVFCAGNDKTFEFLQDILTEVMNLFPSEIIHIGGDEVPKVRWQLCPKCQARMKTFNLKNENELQSYFIERIEKFINSKGRRIIGWDEILEGGLAPNASVMSWRGIDGGIAAAKAKHFAVMSPGTHCYFDHYQGLNNEPQAIGGYTPLEKVYSYEPVPSALTPDEAKYILGAQANLWTEYIQSTDHVEYMLLPRLLALSEVVWSPKESRNFPSFMQRISKHYDILAKLNYNFRIPPPLPDDNEVFISENQKIEFNKPIPDSKIYYTIDGTQPSTASLLYTSPLTISSNTFINAKTFLANGKTSPLSSVAFSIIDTTVNGLKYKYYEGIWDSIPNLDALKAKSEGKIRRIRTLDVNPSAESFAVAFNGYINIETEGNYTFYLTSDDGSILYVNNTQVVDNDGAHSSIEKNGSINLSIGKIPIKILYFNKWGSQSLKLEYDGPGISKRILSASSLFFNN